MMRFHHIGIIVQDINDCESKMIYEKKIYQVFDPIQHCNLALYKNFGDSFIELIQPIDKNAFTWNFLQKNQNTSFHHLCYEVKNYKILEDIRVRYKLIHILGPVPALLFNGKQVSFFYTRNKKIVEFLILDDESTSHF